MVKKDDVDFYCGFSRKELQSLCKKYNLPANRSRSDMAVSLASYFEQSGLNQDSLATISRAPASRTWDVKRDSSGNELARARENGFQGVVAREPSSTLWVNRPYQERNGNGGFIHYASAPPYLRELDVKDPTSDSKKVVFSKTDSRLEVDNGDSPSSSSFEFHVSLEEGISLSVDLNFNPSDWINRMRDEVNVCDSMRRRKSPRSDLSVSNATECKKQKSSLQDKDEDARRESSISPEIKNNTQLPSDHHSNGERSLESSAIEPCSRIKESSDTCKEGNRLNLSIPNQIVSSCAESFSCYVNPVDLDCVKKLTSDSVMVAAEENHPPGDLLTEIPSMEVFQKVGNSSTGLSTSEEAETYHSNPPCSPRKTSRFSTLSSPELIIDRGSISYTELFKFQYNGGNNCLQPNTEDQEKSEVLSEQARS